MLSAAPKIFITVFFSSGFAVLHTFFSRCKQNVKKTNKQTKNIKKSKVMKFWGFILCLMTLLVIPQCLVMVYKSDYIRWCCDRAE